MVLLNAASRARNVASLVTQNQGGGNTKAGLPYIVGRTSSSSMYLANDSGGCTVPAMAITYAFAPDSRPINIMSQNPRLRVRF
jgi:hypothetical protein